MSTNKIPITFYLDKDLEDWHNSLPEKCNRSKSINSLMRKALAGDGEAPSKAPSPEVSIPAGELLVSPPSAAIPCWPVAEPSQNGAVMLLLNALRKNVDDLKIEFEAMTNSHTAMDKRVEAVEDQINDPPECPCSENHDSDGIDRLSKSVDRYRDQVQQLEEEMTQLKQRLHDLEPQK